MWVKFQNNPAGRNVGDCAVRAISKALSVDWETAYAMLVAYGYMLSDMPSSDAVSGAVLRKHGFVREALPDTCPDCFTAEDFCRENPHGTFVLYFGGHVAAAVDGKIYDSWDSSHEIPQFVWRKR
jgi:hypothetical protein